MAVKLPHWIKTITRLTAGLDLKAAPMRAAPPTPIQEQPVRRFIDFQLSLQAVISGAVVAGTFMVWMGWQAAQQTNISLQTQASVIKLEKRFDDKDTKIEDMREKSSEQRGDINSLKLRVDILERVRK